MSIKRMAGVTLVELIVAIAIVGMALAGLVAAYNRANIASSDPLVTQQMLAIAESMMEEVMQKPFAVDTTPATERRFFNDIRDYAKYGPVAVSNVNGDLVPDLARYQVAVRVSAPGSDGIPLIQGIPAAEALRIQVTVSTAGAEPVMLTGWRTKP